MNNAPIGIFDSGVGGLTVVREVIRQMPDERIVYFGDTARVPYGSKSQSTIIRFSRQDIAFLKSKGVKAIAVACNTASALALPAIEKEVDIPIIGVVNCGAKLAAEKTKNGRVGVIATKATVNSGIHKAVMESVNPDIVTVGKACPLFVPLVEECMFHDVVTEEMAKRYLQILKDRGVDTVILGCTHYPFLRGTIQRIMGDDVTLINPAYETACELKRLLTRDGLLGEKPRHGEKKYSFYVSDGAASFRDFAARALEMELGPDDVEEIHIENF